jgi:hypothetical protein
MLRPGKTATPDEAGREATPASGAAEDATKPVTVGVVASWRAGPRRVLRASDLAKGAERGRREGRDKESLQQQRVERDHADRDALGS